jgi:hypothetical protein
MREGRCQRLLGGGGVGDDTGRLLGELERGRRPARRGQQGGAPARAQEDLVRNHRQLTEDVYHGRFGGHPPLAELVPGVDLDAFKHVAALVSLQLFAAPPCSRAVGDPGR